MRKRPHTDPTHRYLDDLAHYKKPKTEIKTETPPNEKPTVLLDRAPVTLKILKKKFRDFKFLPMNLQEYFHLLPIEFLISDQMKAMKTQSPSKQHGKVTKIPTLIQWIPNWRIRSSMPEHIPPKRSSEL